VELVIPDKKKAKITIYGVSYDVMKPTVSLMEQFTYGMDSVDDKEKFKRSKELVSKLGIPMDVLDSLEIDHFTMIMEFLTSQVKKN
jgi:hypothetical protein